MQDVDARLRAIVASSARRGRWFALVFVLLGALFVAMGARELLARLDEQRAYAAEVDDIKNSAQGDEADELLRRAENEYLFAGHSTKKGLLFLAIGVLQLLFAVISRVRVMRNYARAYRLLAQPNRIAKITCRTVTTPVSAKSVVVGGEMLDIDAVDGTSCYFNATHDQLADLLEMLAPCGMIVERDLRGAIKLRRGLV